MDVSDDLPAAVAQKASPWLRSGFEEEVANQYEE